VKEARVATGAATPFAAFVSYRNAHSDARVATWLERSLRTFRLPQDMRYEHPGYDPTTPSSIGRVFRDDDDLPAGGDLERALMDRLDRSGALVVVCSPRTPESQWIDREVRRFEDQGRAQRVFLLLSEGTLERSAPRSLIDAAENRSLAASQPLAASLVAKPGESGRVRRRRAIVKLVAAITDTEPDLLWRRSERERRTRLLKVALALSIAACAVLLAYGYQIARARDRVLRLSDLKVIHELNSDFERLGAPLPQNVGRMQDWLRRAAELIGHRSTHASDWSALTDAAHWQDPLPAARTEALTTETAWVADLLRQVLRGIDQLERINVPEVRRRLDTATDIRFRTVESPDARAAWEAAIEAIRRSDRYLLPNHGQFILQPQVGLIPLSANENGYWEFWHVLSGSAPRATPPGTPSASRWQCSGDEGVVLVLLPGGTFLRGAQADGSHPSASDPLARPDEGPPNEQVVEPFFVSKYEMTQGQWRRASGVNPSYFQRGTLLRDARGERLDLLDYTEAHPVEQVSWHDVTNLLASLDLELPTETQWEYMARADAKTRWVGGDSFAAIASSINCQHSLLLLEEGRPDSIPEPWKISNVRDEVDGFTAHAAVGSFAPNGFGLHEVLGNVWELCANHKEPYDGSSAIAGSESIVMRGGGFTSTESSARFTRRSSTTRNNRDYSIGLRPVKRLAR
jgi:formylglycine-generating enzyme required for sulfatase activity